MVLYYMNGHTVLGIKFVVAALYRSSRRKIFKMLERNKYAKNSLIMKTLKSKKYMKHLNK